jgi:hypothetical protein
MTERFKIGARYRAWCAGVDCARRFHRGDLTAVAFRNLVADWSAVLRSKVLWDSFKEGCEQMTAALRRGRTRIRSSRPLPQLELDFHYGPVTVDDGC